MRPQVKKIIILSIIVSLVGIVMLGASFYFFYINGIQVNEEKLKTLLADLEIKKRLEREIPGLVETLKQIKLRAQKARQQVPLFDENEFDRFLEQLRDMSISTGVQTNPPRPSQARSGGALPSDIVRATYDLQVAGEFKKLWDFLKVMENSIRFVEIENFDFVKGRDTGPNAPKDEVALIIRTSVFAVRPPPAAPGTAPGPVKQPESELLTTLPPK